MVIAEAMACGRAVITSGSGGAAELIDAGRRRADSRSPETSRTCRAVHRPGWHGDAELRRQLGQSRAGSGVTDVSIRERLALRSAWRRV